MNGDKINIPFIIQMSCFAAAAIFYSIMLLTQKNRRRKVLEKAGEQLYPLSAPPKSKTAMSIFAIPCAMVAAFMIDYSPYFVVLVCAVCSLAIYIVCKEDAAAVNTGIYKNALIAGGSYIEWEKIKGVKEEQFLEIELLDGKKIQIQTASPEETKEIVGAIEKALKK